MELIPNTDFGQTLTNKSDSDYRRLRDNFDKFCKQLLAIGMLVPTDKEGNVLEFEVFKGYVILGDNKESKKNKISKGDTLGFIIYEGSKYQSAKERVLFEGFEVEKFGKSGEVWKLKCDEIKVSIFKFSNDNYEFYVKDWSKVIITSQEVRTIEDLVPYKLTLTQTAIKQINK